jgi:hypothetical protein
MNCRVRLGAESVFIKVNKAMTDELNTESIESNNKDVHSDTNSVFDIPGKAEVFQALVGGMHISLQSGEIFYYLSNHAKDYKTELATLGYELIHELDYYYLQPFNDDRSNDYSKRCLVFITIMIESISNEAKDIVETLFHETGFEIDNLPHFSTERYRNYMQNMEVGEDRQLKALLNNILRSVFIEFHEADNFMRFLTPSHRFLQLSLDILAQHSKQTADDETKQ